MSYTTEDIKIVLETLTSNETEVTDWNAYRLLSEYQDEIRNRMGVGVPATYNIGSDSYAVRVESIIRFKTGKQQGRVKAVIADGDLFTLRKDGRLRPDGSDHGSLVIGIAVDYRDPSF